MEKELESMHRCLATKPCGFVCFPRMILKAVGGTSWMEIDRSYGSSRVTEECNSQLERDAEAERERERGREIYGHTMKEKEKMSTV